jgi:peptidoglycan biosynthesis protein MviN/MurJ (putative lipid II flippase)
VTGLAAVVGVVIAREFGRGADTDGFFAAYGLFVVIVIVATGFRIVALPSLARAHGEQRLAAETLGWAVSLAALALPAVLLALLASGWVAGLLTGNLPDAARDTAASVLPWMVPAAILQLYAALAASALAALDDYGTAAVGFVVGSVSGLALILLRVDADGIVAVAWGMFLNGALALLVPVVALAARGRPRLGAPGRAGERLLELWRGVAFALSLQALYLVCLRFAAELGVGAVTSFSYAYLIGAALVAVTASSLSLVSSVPLTRLGIEERGRAAQHVVNTSWLALAVVAGAAGVFAVAGEAVAQGVLGGAYGGEAGTELGRLVVYLAPWMAASIGVSTTFPLLFVAGRARRLALLSAAAVAVHVPIAWAGEQLFELAGIAAALALTNVLLLAGLLILLSRRTFATVARGLATASAWSGGLALASFAALALALSPIPAAAVGLAAYAALLAVLRPAGLVRAWSYVRALG